VSNERIYSFRIWFNCLFGVFSIVRCFAKTGWLAISPFKKDGFRVGRLVTAARPQNEEIIMGFRQQNTSFSASKYFHLLLG
jgi:hypothetical protein